MDEIVTAAPARQPTEAELGPLPRGLISQTDDDGGTRWISCDPLTSGDYGGAGSVGVANQRELHRHAERPDWFEGDPDDETAHVEMERDRWSVTAWCLDTAANRELLRGLVENYSLLDDESMSAVEAEWELEALRGWALDDIGRELDKDYGDAWRDHWDSLPSGIGEGEPDHSGPSRYGIYHAAMEVENQCAESEYNGVSIPIGTIIDAVAALMLPSFGATADGAATMDGWLSDDAPGLAPPTTWTDGACWACLSDEILARSHDSPLAAHLAKAVTVAKYLG